MGFLIQGLQCPHMRWADFDKQQPGRARPIEQLSKSRIKFLATRLPNLIDRSGELWVCTLIAFPFRRSEWRNKNNNANETCHCRPFLYFLPHKSLICATSTSITHLVRHFRAQEVELPGAGVEEGVEVAVVAELGTQDAEDVRVVPGW